MTIRTECVLVEDRLPRLLENDLPAGELLLVRAHLVDCADCASALSEFESLADSIASSRAAQDLIDDAVARTRVALETSAGIESSPSRTYALGAATLVFATVGFLVGPPSGMTFAAIRDLPRAIVRSAEPLARSFEVPLFLRPFERGDEGSGR